MVRVRGKEEERESGEWRETERERERERESNTRAKCQSLQDQSMGLTCSMMSLADSVLPAPDSPLTMQH